MSEDSNFSDYNIHLKRDYLNKAFSRNIGLFSEQDQKKLEGSRVAIPGMGGVGGIHLITMVRSGIGKFHIADFDVYEPVNINRQYGANTSTFGRDKLEVMKEQALLINPYIEIKTFPDGINQDNIDNFLKDVDVVIDGLDFFCFDIRRLLFNKAKKKGIYVITAGPMGYSSALLVFAPDRGMGFDQYFNITDNMSDEDKSLSFALGLAPRPTHIKYMDLGKVDLEQKAGPSLNASCQLCAGMAATEAFRILLNKKGLRPVPYYCQFDPYLMKLKKGRLYFGNKNPIQQLKMFIVKKLLAANKGIKKESMPLVPDDLFDDDKILSKNGIDFLINAGIQAPSGDNAQPWKFEPSSNKINVLADLDADRSFFNVNQIASIISCGAVMENIKIASSHLGLTSEIDCFADQQMPGASIEFNKGQIEKDILFESIWKRHTNRTMFKRENISSSTIQNCKRSISQFSDARLFAVTQKTELKKLAGIIYKIDRIRTEYRPLHEHLNKMIRFNSDEVYRTQDGLPLKNLQAGFAGEEFLKFTKPWPIMNFLNKIGIGRMVAMHSYQGIVNSSAVMLVTINGIEDNDFFTGGRALQRVWLELTRLGYHVQPMTAVTLFLMRLLFKKENEFLPQHIKLLDSVREEYFNLFPGLERKHGQIMLFRIGHGQNIKHFTLRKKVDSFMRQT